MTSFYHLLTIVSLISSYVERDMGGKVTYTDNEKEKGIILRWEKLDPKTNKRLRYNYKISYDEIEEITEPFAFAQNIIEAYHKREKNA